MKIKKLVSSLLIITFIFTQMVFPAYAADSMSFTVGSCDVSPGETVSIPISLSSNSGFVSMSLSVTYDTSALTLISYDDTGVIVGASHSSHFISPYVLTWENDTLTSNIISTGTIAYLTFLVSEDAKEQDYSVIVRIPTDGILDANGNSVSASSAMGTITVSAEHECSFGDWEYYSKIKHVRYCGDCDEKEYKNHSWDDGKILKQPTHDEEGEIKYTCEDCEYSYTTEIDPEGHDWGDWTELNDTQHKRSCSCGDEKIESHNWDNGVVTAEIRTYTCEDCNATKDEKLLPDTTVVTGIAFDKNNITLSLDGKNISTILNAIITPEDATNTEIVWKNSNESVVDMAFFDGKNSKALLVALSKGVATITATTVDGGFVAECTVVVGGEKTIVRYEMYVGALRHKVIYSDDTYDIEDCAPADCVCGRQYEDVPDEYVPGDVNGDGVLNENDVTRFMQYNAGWNVDVNSSVLDVNLDGRVNNKDVSRLMQYIAGWPVEIY